jgi:hypothetical protein
MNNFGIYCLEHFSCKNLRKSWSKGAKPIWKHARTPCARRRSTPRCLAAVPAVRTRRGRPVSSGSCAVPGLLCACCEQVRGRHHAAISHLPESRTALRRWVTSHAHVAVRSHVAIRSHVAARPRPYRDPTGSGRWWTAFPTTRSVIKALPSFPLACNELRRPPLMPPRWAPPSACIPSQWALLAPALGHPEAHTAARCPAPSLSSPKFRHPRPLHHCSAVPTRRSSPCPQIRCQSTLGELNHMGVPFVASPRPQSAVSSPLPPGAWLWGLLAQGHIYEGSKFLRACLQVDSILFGSFVQWIVKCIEIQGKFRKIQNQFCWFACEDYYNFCKGCIYFCVIIFAWKIKNSLP